LSYCQHGFVQDKYNTQGAEEWAEFFGLWHEIVASKTEDIYNERLEKWKQRYIRDFANEVSYIMQIWLDLYKERFVKAWVNRKLNFEQYVTSRAEGIHQLIKSHYKTRQINLF
jgi:histone-lysine N-methyltransferase SETD2